MKNNNKNNWKGKYLFPLLIVAAFGLGYFAKDYISVRSGEEHSHADDSDQKAQMWTCSMHPEIQSEKPGKCPKCLMDLIPVESGEDAGISEISFSENALKLMEIQTTVVERKFVDAHVRLTGKISYDETKLKNITAWAGGRIDRLYVDFTGTSVIKGDHMVYLYSPELVSAQAEFLQALKSFQNVKTDSSDLLKRSTKSTYEAAGEKLRLLGLGPEQVKEIEKTGEATDHITINAPIGGIVIKKHVTEGAYVQTGTIIYTIADLSSLWVQLDAYESDLAWIRYGQKVEFTTEAYPGKFFTGQVSFISPTVDPKTRTIKVRLNVSNAEGMLKPEMFVTAVVHSRVASEGKVMASDMAGKWICPMHPSIIKDQVGTCDICQMNLVTTESLGYVTADDPEKAPLVIPVTSALLTGKRAVVYVQVPEAIKPTFTGREVILGPRVSDHYIVKEGLAEGEVVVSNGNFKIDSALQIQAKSSMMSPKVTSMSMEHQDAAIKGQQTLCPVMGGKINKNEFITYKGKKVYFCCPGCSEIFLKDPDKYMSKLPQFND